MGKYDPIRDFLKKNRKNEVKLNIKEIENIIRLKLPNASKHHIAWWSNTKSHPQGKAWLDAGWIVEKPSDAINLGFIKFVKKTNMNSDYKKCSEENLPYETYERQFEFLTANVLKNQENLEKTILTLSSSFLALSVAFLGLYDDLSTLINKNCLFISWGLFGLSILFILVNYAFSVLSSNYEIEYVGDMMEGKDKDYKNEWNTLVDRLYYFAGISFIAGITFLLIFCGLQI